jgi:hypothetical protein
MTNAKQLHRAPRVFRSLLGLLLLVAAAPGCNVDPYPLVHGGDGGMGGGGDGGPDDDSGMGPLKPDAMIGPDARPAPDACAPIAEQCNGKDDDCDDGLPGGGVDEDFNLQQDPANCGSCGNKCTYPNGFGACQQGQCAFTGCQPGWIDTNQNVDGCEYQCSPTNGGVEVCDLVDNDCDLGQPGGGIDEDFGLDDDPQNCGACGNVCTLLHAQAKCVDPDGNGLGECVVATCDPGFHDNNPAVPGCEYQCAPSNGGVELCDGVDNDCDLGAPGGGIDDGNPGGGASCLPSGACTAGTTVCTFGILQCQGATFGTPEICNNVDDDCDGTIDDGFNKETNPNTCGPNCTVCSIPFATPKCQAGVCGIFACQFGHFNNDGSEQNGCEYACIQTGSELCDGKDNDCDLGLPGGGIDEGFNTQTDPFNCGSCGNTCSFPHADAQCQAGGCVQGACDPNFYDLSAAIPGCEYACIKSNGGVETCDGLDNDCDGVADDGNPGANADCGTETGECTFGKTNCVGGQLICQGGTGPIAEQCDNKDNDCDGAFDETFDKLNDPSHCGANCTVCSVPFATPNCSAGVCGVGSCLPGHVNLNGSAADGCEYACSPTGVEICDGVDNDCDGKVDALDPDLPPAPAICNQTGPCAGAVATCTGVGGWDCTYSNPDVQKDANGDLVLQETLCDGKDNDCDGVADDSFPLKNTACAEDGTFGTPAKNGICRGTGTLGCNAAQTGLVCNVTIMGAMPVNEQCNNLDDDCDGHVDESWDAGGFLGVRDTKVTIAAATPYRIFKFEASRPDATAALPGVAETRACSIAGRQPWGSADFNEAQAACAGAGMRLCKVTRTTCSGSGASFCCSGTVTADEWGRACQDDGLATPLDVDYPYAPGAGAGGYQANTCNGSDFDADAATAGNQDAPLVTGNRTTCVQNQANLADARNVNDLSGNLKEWTNDPRCSGAGVVHTLRGGAYDNGSGGLTCDFDFSVAQQSYNFPNVGFRCCSINCADGLAECNNACVNLATSNTNCGKCGTSCAVGKTCQNGRCL